MQLFHYRDRTINVSYSLDKDFSHVSQKIHMHNDYELYCFISGDTRYMIEGREVLLDYGTVLIMRPGELHTSLLDSDKAYERIVVNFTPEALPEDLREPLLRPFRERPLGEMNVYRASDFPGLTPRDLLASMCASSENAELRIRTMLPAVLTLLQFSSPKEIRAADTRSVGAEIVDYVNAHLCDPVSLSEVAEHFYMSVSQVSRIFKAATGTTVGQYSLTKRLLKARRRISGGESVQQAARDCGFSCYSSFFRLYKKKFGVAPSEET